MSNNKSHEDGKHDINPKNGLYLKKDSKSVKFVEGNGFWQVGTSSILLTFLEFVVTIQ